MVDGLKPVDMRFQQIDPIGGLTPKVQQPAEQSEQQASFVDMLRSQLDQVIELQNAAEQLQQELAAGKIDNINEVILAVQKADLALTFTMELRNKVIEAYQEISRMQI